MQPPDLSTLASLLAKQAGFSQSAVDRLAKCPESALALMMLRVLSAYMRERGIMDDATENRLIAQATPRLDPVQAMMAAEPTTVKLSSVMALVAEIDVALCNPALVTKFPRWFVDQLWPGVLSRLALGERMSNREEMIARRIIAEVKS